MNANRLLKLRMILVVTPVLTVVLTASAGAAGKKPRPTPDAEFKALMARYYEAWNTLDLNQPDRFYAKDADLVHYDIAPLKYRNWSEYRAGVKQLFEQFSTFKLIPNDDLRVSRRGTIAWVTLTLRLSGVQKDGKQMNLDARHTAVWEKRGGQWLIVHEHVSTPLPG
ncbi:MAG TPA: nuclear transport factor 2 family protein [Blastocatellia bacterium]|nr:nuclear transport factor 2 family protein [Blastocatellia bacterium]